MQVHEGRDAQGFYSVQFSLKKGDPLLAALRSLVPKAAKLHKDRETGFSMEGEGNEMAAQELGAILRAALPSEVRERLLLKAAQARAAMDKTRQDFVKDAASKFLGDKASALSVFIENLGEERQMT